MKNYFYCASCQLHRPIEQLGKIVKGSHSKRCTTCCEKAESAKNQLAKSPSLSIKEY